jgi:hypothetical protein
MKTAISIPDELFRAADQAAKRLGLSRSQLYQRAIVFFLERQGDRVVTEALNDVYSERMDLPDPVLARMQRASLPPEPW